MYLGGWLPKWASPGYRGSMVGTMGDVSVADAIVKVGVYIYVWVYVCMYECAFMY